MSNKNIFPDNDYGDAASWNGEVDGTPATFGVFKPGADLSFPVDPRGEHVILFEPDESAHLSIDILDSEGNAVRSIELNASNPDVQLPPEVPIRVSTDADGGEVQYLCLYENTEA